ncbi:MAG: phosphoribosylformylglycinamidine synthase [Bacteriovoracaceae bacterium]|nr:phosphoribosylformylglycinamidine synthase [Bacteriovoracaceae bacterium]
MYSLRLEIKSNISNKSLTEWVKDSNRYLSIPLKNLEKVNCYNIEVDSDKPFDEQKLSVFFDPITADIFCEDKDHLNSCDYVVSVSFKPGVTDNPAHTAQEALALLDVTALVSSGELYLLSGQMDINDAKKIGTELLANEIIQVVNVYSYADFKNLKRFNKVHLPKVVLPPNPKVEEMALNLDDQDLESLSTNRCLALSLEEMKYIKAFYEDKKNIKYRKAKGLSKWPSDVELEIFAQTWSEHCKHKIFSSDIDYRELNLENTYKVLGNKKISSLYSTYIKGATKKVEQDRKLDWLISVFSDNAGIVRFDPQVDFCIKVETHNSPSALDPYGGALTGILGVNRDIMGTGIGAKPIANMDVFCFAPPNWPSSSELDLLPMGVSHPRKILEGVHKGVEDGGNKSGIPTVNGAFYFDRDYAGKPLVFVGTVGVMPHKTKQGIDTYKKRTKNGDRIVMIGGAIGSDGIHGATFSSMELNESSPSTAVQIGDPLTQKRVLDLILEAQNLGLYTSITDNGAGGLSSSVGEMATLTGGASMDLSLCPVKYPGLTPYELMISESQERMTLSVAPKHLKSFLDLAKKRGVIATDIGHFNCSGQLEVFYKKQLVADIPLDFLHESLPPMKLKASWSGARPRANFRQLPPKLTMPSITKIDKNQVETSDFFKSALLALLAKDNISSKESWVRRYDHEVLAATYIKPFVGKTKMGPADCGVIWAHPHGGSKENAIAIGCGLAPKYSQVDPYIMAQYAVDEALRNVVASGADPSTSCILDNFCWPDPVAGPKNPDGEYKLAALVRACVGLYDICLAYGLPMVSGKDSMKNDFKGKNRRGDDLSISILPTLLITCMAKTPIHYTVTSDFKQAGDIIFLVGKQGMGLLASEFSDIYELNGSRAHDKLTPVDLSANIGLYKQIFSANKDKLIKSCHDVSDGGALVAIVESMIGGDLGARVDLLENDFGYILNLFFNESSGRFIVTVGQDEVEQFLKHFTSYEVLKLGAVTNFKQLEIVKNSKALVSLPLADLTTAWQTEL